METPREWNWQLYMFLTVLFNGLFSLTVWERILPRAVLFEGQSWQLVDLTFSSYVQSSFHSKVKLLLLAVTFTCGSLWYSKKMKARLETHSYLNCQKKKVVQRKQYQYLSVSVIKIAPVFVKNETFSSPTLDLSAFLSLVSIWSVPAVILSIILKKHRKLSALTLGE